MSPGAALPADDDASQQAFLETDPPHWVARGLAYILIALFVGLVLISVAVEVPETVSAPFVLVPGTFAGDPGRDGDGEDLQAELIVPQSALALISPGQSVKMLYDAFPYQRYGVRYGTVGSATPVSVSGDDRSEFVVIADPAERVVVVNGQDRPLLPGMRGTARIVVGSRSLIAYAFEPLRMLRETVAAPPAAPAPNDQSEPANAR
jgi:multidrug efflux pump subunit AcrA (membrane-fusion protein)